MILFAAAKLPLNTDKAKIYIVQDNHNKIRYADDSADSKLKMETKLILRQVNKVKIEERTI